MDAQSKISTAKEKKDAGDQAFKAGEVVNGTERRTVSSVQSYIQIPNSRCMSALRAYHEVNFSGLFCYYIAPIIDLSHKALLYLHGISKYVTHYESLVNGSRKYVEGMCRVLCQAGLRLTRATSNLRRR